jgi:hypothetical protein
MPLTKTPPRAPAVRRAPVVPVEEPPPPDYNHDLACAVWLGFLEVPGMAVSPDAIVKVTPRTHKRSTTVDWLCEADALGAIVLRLTNIHPSTAEYQELREVARTLLIKREVLTLALAQGARLKPVKL